MDKAVLKHQKAQLAVFNTYLSNFMENMNNDSKENILDMNEFDDNNHSSAFNYQEVLDTEETKEPQAVLHR
ncbi:hypothetical protein RYX36_037053 [Vicia faba]